MLRYQERQRAARSAPWPDHVPRTASTANRWKYVYVRGLGRAVRVEHDDDRDPLMVLVLFARYDRRRLLTRLYIKRKPMLSFAPGERWRASEARRQFEQSLCSHGLLEVPPKSCFQNAKKKFPSCRCGCRSDGRKRLTNKNRKA